MPRRKKKVTETQSIISGSVPQGGHIIMMTNVTSTGAPFCLRSTRRVASPLRRRHLNANCTELVSHYGASVNQYRHFRCGVSRHGDAQRWEARVSNRSVPGCTDASRSDLRESAAMVESSTVEMSVREFNDTYTLSLEKSVFWEFIIQLWRDYCLNSFYFLGDRL